MIVSLNPPLEGITADRFLALARELKRNQRSRNLIDFQRICDAEIDWCRNHPHLDGQREVYEGEHSLFVGFLSGHGSW